MPAPRYTDTLEPSYRIPEFSLLNTCRDLTRLVGERDRRVQPVVYRMMVEGRRELWVNSIEVIGPVGDLPTSSFSGSDPGVIASIDRVSKVSTAYQTIHDRLRVVLSAARKTVAVIPVGVGSASTHQASYEVVCEVLRGVLVDSVQAGPGPGGTGSIRCRVSGALYALLMNHPIDHQGRCRSCRRPGAVLGLTRQCCRVHRQVHYWLRQPDAFLHAQLARECGLADPSPTQPSQSPAVSTALPSRGAPRVGRPVSTHGGTGAYPPITPGSAVFHPATPISLTGSLVHTGDVPLPLGGETSAVGVALCGALLCPDQVETVTPSQGVPCSLCLVSQVRTEVPPTPATYPPADADIGRHEPQTADYQSWGWPVTQHRNEIWLTLKPDNVALIIPVPLAAHVTAILRQRRCPPPVLAHPDTPEHQIMLAGQP